MLIRCADFDNVTHLFLTELYDSFLEATKVVHGELRRHSLGDWLGKFTSYHWLNTDTRQRRGHRLGGKRAGIIGKQISVAIL